MTIYMDNAATTKTSRIALEEMLYHMQNIYSNPSSLHTGGQKAAEALHAARQSIADLLGCHPREIIFTSGGTESNNQAIFSAAKIGDKKGRKHIIASAFEHHAVLHTLDKLSKEGFRITFIQPTEDGMITPESVDAAIQEDTCLVTIMYANNEIGTIQPISAIGGICRKHGVLFHTDAVQAAGHLPIHVNQDNIDLLSLSAHKFHGPRGVGLLYARKGVLISRLIEGGAQEGMRRPGTENLPAIGGMAAAFAETCRERAETTKRVSAMRDRLIEGLSHIPHSRLTGDSEHRLPGNVHFCFEGIEGESLLLSLDQHGIQASSGSACTSGSLEPSHVLLSLGYPHEIAHGSLRLSLSKFTTNHEVDTVLSVLPGIIEYLRSISPLWRDLKEGRKPHVIQ